MNKEYLFEKTGGDAEIERLESVLSAYRFEAARPPVLPEARQAGRAWSFGWLRVSFAAGAVAVAVVAGLLAFGRIEKLLVHADRPEISDNVRPSLSEPPSEVVTPTSATGNQISIGDSRTFRKVQPAPQHVAFSQRRTPVRLPARSKPHVELTRQEKYAYDQLMVALYITGTKLKVVQDTINWNETMSEVQKSK